MFTGAPMKTSISLWMLMERVILGLRLQWPQLLAMYGQHCAVGMHDRRCWMHVAEGEGATGARIMFKSRNKV